MGKRIAAMLCVFCMIVGMVSNPLLEIVVHAEENSFGEDLYLQSSDSGRNEVDATGIKSGTYSYRISEDGSAIINGYSGKETELVIPEKLDGRDVTGIDFYTFYSKQNLISIEIPKSMKEFFPAAFFNCGNLINFNVDAENTLYTSENGILFNKSKTQVLFCPRGKEGRICLPESVTVIQDNAFAYCKNITEIEILGNVTAIEDEAFYTCCGLTEIKIPASVARIGENVFNNCSNLKNIIVDSGNIVYFSDNGILYNKEKTEILRCPEGKSGEIDILENVEAVGDDAFSNCANLTNIVFSERVVKIGDDAFYCCCELTEMELPKSVASIGSRAFEGCNRIISIEIPENVTELGDYVFSGCSSLENIMIPDSLSMLKQNMFEGTKWWDGQLESSSMVILNGVLLAVNIEMSGSIVVPEGVSIIADSAFESCSGLNEIKLPDSVARIGDNAFSGCSGLNEIKLPDSITSIGKWAFSHCSNLREIALPKNVTDIKFGLFEDCSSLANVELPENLLHIECEAFVYCYSLTNIRLPKNVMNIEYGAFYGCVNLNKFEISSENEKYLTQDGILYNKAMTTVICCPGGKKGKVILPENVTDIADYAFCSSRLTGIELPDGVINIGYRAFSGSGLTEIKLPENITIIRTRAFEATNLKSVKIPGKVTSIEMDAFFYCNNLVSIELPVSIKFIGRTAFNTADFVLKDIYYAGSKQQWEEIWCEDYPNPILEKANIHYNWGVAETSCSHTYKNAVTTQPTCTRTGVKTYTCTKCNHQYNETIARTNHTYINGKCKLCGQIAITASDVPNAPDNQKTVPLAKGKTFTDSKTKYRFKVTSPSAAKPTAAFAGTVKKEKKVTIPPSVTYQGITYQVTSVSAKALKGNTKITSLVVGKNITKIEKNAFEGCKNLNSITVKSKKLRSVGKNALKGIHKKCRIKVPSAKLKTYKKLFKKKGQKSSVKIGK